jgi:carbamoyl-phosphate synthase small subunit
MQSKKTASRTSETTGRLILEDGSVFPGVSFGSPNSVAGEVVFNTGMTGYPETLTDPSYTGQILVLTFPLIGNYGVPTEKAIDNLSQLFESEGVRISGLVVSDYSNQHSHWNSGQSLSQWLNSHRIPALHNIDTRALTKKLREKGTMLGKIEFSKKPIDFYDANLDNLVEKVSVAKPVTHGSGKTKIVLMDCGCKHNIIHSLVNRKVKVTRVPWDYDLNELNFDGLVVSNGPGDPKMCRQSILQIRRTIERDIPVFGICLGHQLMALAVGANTYKLKYGHRSQNQPVIEAGSNRCLVTSQNHGFAVDNNTLPRDWHPWFINLNDGTNEGMRHSSGRFRSVQFHPEAAPGPVDAGYLFDEFLEVVRS